MATRRSAQPLTARISLMAVIVVGLCTSGSQSFQQLAPGRPHRETGTKSASGPTAHGLPVAAPIPFSRSDVATSNEPPTAARKSKTPSGTTPKSGSQTESAVHPTLTTLNSSATSGATEASNYPTTTAAHPPTTPHGGNGTSVTTVVVNCSGNTSSPQSLPTPVPAAAGGNETGQVVVVMVEFDEGWAGDVNCSWIIPSYSNDTSNAIDFRPATHGTTINNASWCHQRNNNTLTIFDIYPSSGNKWPIITDACREEKDNPSFGLSTVSSHPGSPTLVQLTAQNVRPGSNLTLLSYSAFPWTLCRGDLGQMNASHSPKVLSVPDPVHRFPAKFGCNWQFQAPEKGVVNVRLFSRGGGGGGGGARYPVWDKPVVGGNASYFLLLVPGLPRLTGDIWIPLTEDGMDFSHSGLGGTIVLGFVSADEGGAPPFTITYWADGMQKLCPAIPRQLAASPAQLQAFKGVNRDLHEAAHDRNCSWRISAPSGMVVKLGKLYNMDYLSSMNTRDTLSLGEGQAWGKKILLDKSAAFPFWSEGSSLTVRFHGEAATPRSQFIVTYLAVPAGPCQGHPVELTATEETSNTSQTALSQNDTVSGTKCLWLIRGHSGQRFQVTVTLQHQPGLCQRTWTGSSSVTGYDNGQPDFRHLLRPVCSPISPTTSTTTTTFPSPSNDSWIYTSSPRSNVILIVYDRDPGTSYVTSGVTVSYREFPAGPTGGVGSHMRAAPSLSRLVVATLVTALASALPRWV